MATEPSLRLEMCSLVHAPVIAALHGRCFAPAWGLAAVEEVLAMPGAFGFIAVEAAAAAGPCGFVLCRAAAGECEILSLGVVGGARRRGVAGRLLDAALAAAAERGARDVFLEVAADNAAAEALYRRAGFSPAGRRRNYYRRDEEAIDAVILKRKLGAGN